MAWPCTVPSLIAQIGTNAPSDAEDASVAWKLLIAVGVVAASFVLGAMIARRLQMRDYSFKIGLILFTLLASLAVLTLGWPPKRGIDLSGGVVLIYEVDRELSQPNSIRAVASRLDEQLNREGESKIEVLPDSSDRLDIRLPDGVDRGRVARAIQNLRNSSDVTLHSEGARTQDGNTILAYRVEQQARQVEMDKLVTAVGRRINPGGVKEVTIRQYGKEQIEVIVPEIAEHEVDEIKKRISTSGVLEFRIVANENDDQDIIRAAQKTAGRDVYIGGKPVGRWVKASPDLRLGPDSRASFRQTEARGNEVLVRLTPFDIDDGRNLNRASSGFDNGKLAVHFSFDAVGAKKFGELTRRNLPDETIKLHRHLGIILDDTMISAPQLNEVIHGEGQITGTFTQDDVDFLVGVLNAGSLPATLRPDPISQQRISSQLGDDTIRMGTEAMVFSTAAVLVFMLVYYRFAGVVADIAVVLNLVVTVALMILVKAAFTLPGLAGLVLTVGMAVDANVLIYERIREETERGASLRMAIRNGFSRAMATIIDSHVTCLVSGVVLYIVGTDQIKGFAVTLIIGLLMSLFTAVYVARVIFDIAEKKRWITRLKMMHVIGHTNIDFIRWRGPAIAGSVIILMIGMVATALRGTELLDIDFTGGSSVQLLFADDKPHDIAQVRQAVKDLPDVAVSSVGDNNLEFKVDTSDRDIMHVQAVLQQEFGNVLQTYSMTHGPLATIEKPAPEVKTDEAKDATATASTTVPSESEPGRDHPASQRAADTTSAGSRLVGGTQVSLAFPQEISHARLEEMLQKELDQMQLKDVSFELTNPKYQSGSDAPFGEWTLQTSLNQNRTESLLENIQKDLAKMPVFPSSNQIGGKVAGDTQMMALYAILASMAIIVVYVWFRFENVIFGLAAVLALFHDVLVTIAFLALSSYLSPYLGFLLVDPFKISLAVMAALLTIVGFSINDKIVVFDRIREVRGKKGELTGDVVNASINQALSRTILTSGTVFIASVILYFLGGPGIHAFAFAMTVGVIAGTYSSVYIAAPVLLWMKKRSAPATRSEAVLIGSAGL